MKRLDAKIKLPNPTKDKGSEMSYKHLTLKERYLINAYRNTKTQKEIAKIVGVHPSTISRELKRGRGKIGKEYWVIASHNRATEVQIEKSKKANLKLTKETVDITSCYTAVDYMVKTIKIKSESSCHA